MIGSIFKVSGLLVLVFVLNLKAMANEAIYYSISPAFVVSLKTADNKKRYLQVRLGINAKDWGTIDQIKGNLPMVRDRLMMLLSNQNIERLTQMSEKKKLLVSAKDKLNAMMAELGYPQNVDEVLITEYVVE